MKLRRARQTGLTTPLLVSMSWVAAQERLSEASLLVGSASC